MFFGTARTSETRHDASDHLGPSAGKGDGDVLRSGICTRKSFLHSFGFVMCAGMKGYCTTHFKLALTFVRRASRREAGMNANTHHERLKVRPPPLREAVSNLPLVVHAVRRVELLRVRGWRKAVVQALLQAFNLVLARLEVVPGPAWDSVGIFPRGTGRRERWRRSSAGRRRTV